MKPHVAVIDDNADLTEDIRELFEETGARVSVFGDAATAEAALADDPHDLVLVDVRRPNRGGLAILPRLTRLSPDAEVIVMTGSATVHSAMEAVRHGVHAYLSKPFDPADLLRLADRALAQVALRRERTSLSRELARSEALHRAVIDTVDSLIIGVDDDTRVRLWNDATAQTTGWRADEVMGRDVCRVLGEDLTEGRLRAMASAAREGGAGQARVPIRTRSGDERIVLWTVRPLVPDTAGGPMVLLAGTDLTERLELEARAASAEAMAAMGRLTSALAHEIRNPLNAATLQLELLKRGAKADAKLAHKAEIVSSEIRRLASLLDDFLGLARPHRFAMRATDLGALLRAIHELQEPSAREAGLELTLHVEADPPPIEADAGRLKQALINLVVNAIEATEGHGSRVSLRLQAEDGDVIIAVEDDGPGLPTETRVLEPFETTKEGGTGLGLPIVKRIAEAHGGALDLGPGEVRGTRVAIRLPRPEAQPVRGPS